MKVFNRRTIKIEKIPIYTFILFFCINTNFNLGNIKIFNIFNEGLFLTDEMHLFLIKTWPVVIIKQVDEGSKKMKS